MRFDGDSRSVENHTGRLAEDARTVDGAGHAPARTVLTNAIPQHLRRTTVAVRRTFCRRVNTHRSVLGEVCSSLAGKAPRCVAHRTVRATRLAVRCSGYLVEMLIKPIKTHDTAAVLNFAPRWDGNRFLFSVETEAKASVRCGIRVETAVRSFLRVAVDVVCHAVGTFKAPNGLVSITVAKKRAPRDAHPVSHDVVWLTFDARPIERTSDAVLIRTRCG